MANYFITSLGGTFSYRVYDEYQIKIFSTPYGTGAGDYSGEGGIGFADGSFLQWGSVWRGGTGGDKRSFYFLYGKFIPSDE